MTKRSFDKIAAGLNEAIVRTMLANLYTPTEIDQWLRSPHKLLGGKSADELIAEGRADEVKLVVQQILDGVYL